MHPVDDELVLQEGFIGYAMDIYESIKPFSDYLNWNDA